MKKLKIGITIGLKSTDESIWTNGMKQNVLFLYKLLSHSVKNYDVWILNTTNLDLTEKPHAFKDVQIASMKDKYEDIDLKYFKILIINLYFKLINLKKKKIIIFLNI